MAVEITLVHGEEFKRVEFETMKPEIISLTQTAMKNENLKETLQDIVHVLVLSKAVFADGVQITDLFQLPKFLDAGKDIETELSKALEELKHLSPEAVLDTLEYTLKLIHELVKPSEQIA